MADEPVVITGYAHIVLQDDELNELFFALYPDDPSPDNPNHKE